MLQQASHGVVSDSWTSLFILYFNIVLWLHLFVAASSEFITSVVNHPRLMDLNVSNNSLGMLALSSCISL